MTENASRDDAKRFNANVLSMAGDRPLGDEILAALLKRRLKYYRFRLLHPRKAKQIRRMSGAAAAVVERLLADKAAVVAHTAQLRRFTRLLSAVERRDEAGAGPKVRIEVDANGRLKLTDEDGREIVRALRRIIDEDGDGTAAA